jgi:predicted enzyme related to lactoylglutathione lyase
LVGYEREHDHAAGVPSWVDLASPDLVLSARFYCRLFDWDVVSRGPADVTGGYLVFQSQERDVAGLGPLRASAEPPAWTIHIAADDVDRTEEAVVSNRGTSVIGPHDVRDEGRAAQFADPTGAVFGAWQGRAHRGAELVGETGAMYWGQLASRDIEAAKRFYGAVFGWEGYTSPYETSTYTRFHLGGLEVAGMIEMDRSWPRGLPSHWMPFFAVDDCDATTGGAIELGGDVPVEPYDMPGIGRAAVLGDPHGAVFSVLSPEKDFSGLGMDAAAAGTTTAPSNGDRTPGPAKRATRSRSQGSSARGRA